MSIDDFPVGIKPIYLLVLFVEDTFAKKLSEELKPEGGKTFTILSFPYNAFICSFVFRVVAVEEIIFGFLPFLEHSISITLSKIPVIVPKGPVRRNN